jgi:hypothetical protein
MATRKRPSGIAKAMDKTARAIAEGQARAEHFLLTAPTCEACGKPMIQRGRARHYLCEPKSIIGRVCTCAPGCTNTLYGNGPAPCNDDCAVCHLLRGQPYKSSG